MKNISIDARIDYRRIWKFFKVYRTRITIVNQFGETRTFLSTTIPFLWLTKIMLKYRLDVIHELTEGHDLQIRPLLKVIK